MSSSSSRDMSLSRPDFNRPALVVFSHLRWDFVYQRPQQLLSRLARDRRVVFVEEPVFDPEPEARFECDIPVPNVLVCRPHTPEGAGGFAPEQIALLLPLVQSLQDQELGDDYVAWLYTPMALPLLAALSPAVVVYDCMDELSAFLDAPPELIARERELFERADLVFTGGTSLFRAKRGLHPSVHCFPSSVEVDHFRQARLGQETVDEAADQMEIPVPRLGYFGVIDERLDLELVDRLAESRPGRSSWWVRS